jgi:hypothetical protein
MLSTMAGGTPMWRISTESTDTPHSAVLHPACPVGGGPIPEELIAVGL